ncbi:hypothetical protein [Candidatus Marithrix sp. Canyon 246]|uniref:hypothetical protein n=1 Tax=Candidatus Marithrix sp. Canyon 246 TaxID=1827136 RepID=UPI000849FF96|nr:hypothetical protein [Candidatus Marithrix sp. Canyon 246]
MDEKSVFNLFDANDNNTQCNVNLQLADQTELQHELEKAQLMIELRDKENELLRQQIIDLLQKP